MGAITIVGTGWTQGQLTLDAARALKSGARVVLHTERCGCAAWLREEGIDFDSLDGLYDSCDDFDEHIRAAAEAVLEVARQGDVVYGVADVRDRTVPALMAGAKDVRVIAGPPSEGALLALSTGDTLCAEASDWEDTRFEARRNALIRELDNRELAAEVKLRLMEVYPEEQEIWLLNADAAPERIPLYALDRAGHYDHRTCALVPAALDILHLERYDFEHLNELMRILCGPNGCPWDRVQTHESLRPYLLEESYEAIDAIDEGSPEHLYEELGDVLLQIALHAEIARKHGEFDITDVTTAICRKMIHRHSHVFGTDRATDAEQVLDLWQRNKMEERGQSAVADTLREVTRALPALLRAVKVLKNSAKAGVHAVDGEEPVQRCAAALDALKGNPADAEALLGEALLSLADAARMRGVDPEIALNGAVNRFIERFQAAEARVQAVGSALKDLSEGDLRSIYWDSVKL